MENARVNHHWGLKGYMFLYLFLYIALSAGLNIISNLIGRMGVTLQWEIWVAVKIVLHFIAAMIVAGRFLSIEKRQPVSRERDYISLFGFLLAVLIMILYLPLFIAFGKGEGVTMTEVRFSAIASMAVLSAASFISLYLNFGILSKSRSVSS